MINPNLNLNHLHPLTIYHQKLRYINQVKHIINYHKVILLSLFIILLISLLHLNLFHYIQQMDRIILHLLLYPFHTCFQTLYYANYLKIQDYNFDSKY